MKSVFGVRESNWLRELGCFLQTCNHDEVMGPGELCVVGCSDPRVTLPKGALRAVGSNVPEVEVYGSEVLRGLAATFKRYKVKGKHSHEDCLAMLIYFIRLYGCPPKGDDLCVFSQERTARSCKKFGIEYLGHIPFSEMTHCDHSKPARGVVCVGPSVPYWNPCQLPEGLRSFTSYPGAHLANAKMLARELSLIVGVALGLKDGGKPVFNEENPFGIGGVTARQCAASFEEWLDEVVATLDSEQQKCVRVGVFTPPHLA